MFFNFDLIKNSRIANKSTTTEANLKISTFLEYLFYKIFNACLAEFKSNKILLNKICHHFLRQPRYLQNETSPLTLIGLPGCQIQPVSGSSDL
jgi:hypothetical protein